MPIHPTAIIDPKAEIDPTVDIGPYCVIDGNVRVARGCRLYHNVYLTGWTEIGEDCILHPGVIVGHEPQDTAYKGDRSYCRIGRGTIVREYATIHRGTDPDSHTVIGEDCFLLGGSHVGHNCRVGNKVTLINDVLLAGHVIIGDGTTLGGGAMVHQFVRIGELAMLQGLSRANMDVPPFALSDNRGKVAGLNSVGLRRAATPKDSVADLRQAYRILFSRNGNFRKALDQVAETAQSPEALRLLEFCRAESRRGIAGGSRRDA